MLNVQLTCNYGCGRDLIVDGGVMTKHRRKVLLLNLPFEKIYEKVVIMLESLDCQERMALPRPRKDPSCEMWVKVLP